MKNPKVLYQEWNAGDVLDKRYRVGQVYDRTERVTVWRMYDGMLRCPVFVLYGETLTKEDLAETAMRLKNVKVKEKDRNILEILAVKRIDKRDVLVFSMKNQDTKTEVFRKWLAGEAAEKEQVKLQENRSENIEKTDCSKSEVLPEWILGENTCLNDRYRNIRCLGIGGFGITYLCEDLLLHRYVALKEYFPEQWAERDDNYVTVKKSAMLPAFLYGMKSFSREIQITANFIHVPHIVTVYDAFEENDTLYMVMEYIDGISIGKELRNRKYQPYTIAEMAEIIMPMLDALETIHQKNIVHSDISPGNMIRAKSGEMVLIDMGAAKYASDDQPALSAAFLKINYAAPEQYQTAREGIPRGEGPWTDIYAVGATMYFLLTGHKPMDVIQRLGSKNSDFAPPKKWKVKLSKKWMKLIHHATALDKEKRIQSIFALREEMGRLMFKKGKSFR